MAWTRDAGEIDKITRDSGITVSQTASTANVEASTYECVELPNGRLVGSCEAEKEAQKPVPQNITPKEQSIPAPQGSDPGSALDLLAQDGFFPSAPQGSDPGSALDQLAAEGFIPHQGLTSVKSSGTQEIKSNGDWRVRLSLGKNNKQFYNASPKEAGILYPLKATNGVIFPYTPGITIQHVAEYSNYELTHSNYRGYFYKGSAVRDITVVSKFTAQDTQEANYMLAVLHFLKSCTKMYYGQDLKRGTPPPMLFLHGFGEYQFNNHPCVITLMNYVLPQNVDYIPAGVPVQESITSEFTTIRPTLVGSSASARRRAGAQLMEGAEENAPRKLGDEVQSDYVKIYSGKTYVPTEIDINFTLTPIQTRLQVSKEFSLKEYASGKLLKRGFW